MKKIEKWYLEFEWKLWAIIISLSFVLHFAVILLFRSYIFNQSQEWFLSGSKNIGISISYITPAMLSFYGWLSSWKIYEKYLESKQFNLYTISLFIMFGIMFMIDKFISNII